jgi:hypothetical protein
MKKKLPLIFAFFISSFFSQIIAQERFDWTRIESENQEVSVSIPSNFLVNKETENYRKKFTAIGFYKDAQMEFSILKPDNPKQNLKNIRILEDSELSAAKISSIKAKQITVILFI